MRTVKNAFKEVSPVATPQNKPLYGKEMIKNDAGGYVFEVSDEEKLRRFLLLGTDKGTYYCSGKDLTVRNFEWIIQFLEQDAKKVLNLTAELSETGALLRNETAIAVLALAWVYNHRQEVRDVFNRVVRIPTHLFTFLNFLKSAFGEKVRYSRKLRNMIRDWYYEKDFDTLVYHFLKYQRRQGWSHKDVLRVTHIKPTSELMDQFYGWIVGKKYAPEHPLINAFIKLRCADTEKEVIDVLKKHPVTWEFVPSQWLKSAKVWEALLPNLPYTALLRNLNRLTALNVLRPFSDTTQYVCERLVNREDIKKSKIHPFKIAIANYTYGQGHGLYGELTWHPIAEVRNALDNAYMSALNFVEPLNKRIVIAIDDSGSMKYGSVSGLQLHDLACLFSFPYIRTEEKVLLLRFSYEKDVYPLSVNKNMSFNDLISQLGLGGGTDCSLPFQWLIQNNVSTDVILLLTDNETWAGRAHPAQVFQRYKELINPNTQLIVCAFTATAGSVADPEDQNQFNVVGFDPNYPRIIEAIVKGK